MKRAASLLPLLFSFPALAGDITLIDANELNWTPTPEGVAFAALEGDRFTEPYRAMVRLEPGVASPPHTKSATMIGVMIEGRMRHYPPGANAESAEIGPGGFYRIPANLPHISACVSADPCVTYLFQDAAFDFRPVTQ